MTEQELKDLVASLATGQAAIAKAQDRTDAQLRETDAQLKANAVQMAETDRKLDRASVLLSRWWTDTAVLARKPQTPIYLP